MIISNLLLLSGCGSPPKPQNIENICAIFHEYPKWYWAAKKSEHRWGVPVPVQLSIMHQESSFNGEAKPGRTKLLWVIPWTRKSDAYGYGQVKDATWDWYERSVGTHFASRNNFADVADFIGWYGNYAHHRAGIPKTDAYRLYLAYHEGIGGYERGTYRNKAWLMKVARRVSYRASVWKNQLRRCQSHIKKPWF